MVRSTYFKWQAIVLVALNLGLLGFLVLNQTSNSPEEDKQENQDESSEEQGRGGHLPMFEEFLRDELNFSEGKMGQYYQAMEIHRSEMREIDMKIMELRRQMMDEQRNGDRSNLEDMARKIGEQVAQKELSIQKHFGAMSDLCDEDQRRQLFQLFDEMGKRLGPMGNGPNGPRHGPPGGPPHGPPGGHPPHGPR